MARRTFLAGEAAVKLVPNARDFHHKARSSISKDPLNKAVELRPNAKNFRSEAKTALAKSNLRADVKLRVDATGFRREAQAKINEGKPLVLKIDLQAKADKASVRTARTEMQAQLTAMGPLKIDLEVNDASAWMTMARFRTQQEARSLSIRVGADTSGARAQMEALRRDQIAQERESAARQERSARSQRGSDSGGGSSLYQKTRNAALASAIVFAPIVSQASIGGLIALAGAASQAGGAIGLLPALATGAAAGIAALGVGLSGISGAFQAATAASDAAATSAADTGAAQAAAARQITSAEKSLTRAQEGVKRAQEDLTKARKDAVRQLRDMNDELDMAPINEREAALAIKKAKKALNEAMASGDVDEIEGARIDLDRSFEEFDQLKKQNQDLAQDVAAANKAGVEGSQGVIDAKRGVADANDAVADAQDQLTAAIEAQTAAMQSNNAAADKLALAMSKLAPNAREFVTAMRALGPEWTELRKAVQDKLFEGMGSSVTDLAKNQLPVLKTGLTGIAGVLNGGVRQALAVFSTDSAIKDFTTTLDNSKGMWAGIADSFAPLSQAFIDLSTVGSGFLPRLGDWIRELSITFGDWIARMRESGQMEEFFQKSIEMAKQLGRIIGDVGSIIGSIFSAGAETGGGFLNTIELVTGELAAFLKSTDGQESLKTFFTGVAEAVRTLAPIIRIVGDVILNTLGPALTDLVIGLGPGLVSMFEGLRVGLEAIAPVMPIVGEAIGTIGQELGEVFAALGPVIADTLKTLAPTIQPIAEILGGLIVALAPILPLLASLFATIVEALAPAFGMLLEALAPFIQLAVDNLMPLMPIISRIFGELAMVMATVVTEILTALMPVLPPLYEAIGQIVSVLGEALIDVLEMLAPYLPEIIEAFVGLVIAILPLIPPLVQVAIQLMPAMLQIFAAVIPIVLRVVDVLTALVNYIAPILIPVITTVSSVVSTVFGFIADVITWAINSVIMPVMNVLTGLITNTGDSFNWLWHEVISPAWNWISNLISDGWNNYIKPAFDALKSGIGSVGDFFRDVTDGIGRKWSELQTITRNPINWVIRNVINGGIGKGWKAVDDFLGGVLPDWNDVGELAVPGMAKGGPVPMEAGAKAGADSVLRNLMPGEFVLSVPAVNALGMDNLAAFNDAARGGRKPGNEGLLPVGQRQINNRLASMGQWGLAPGGEVTKDDPAWQAVKAGMDYALRHSPRPYMWGGSTGPDGGTDCSGWMSEIADVVLGGPGLIRKWATGSFPGGGGSQGDNLMVNGQPWNAGLRAGMSIGVSVPHTAGTIGGLPGLPATNIESGGNTGQGNTFGGPATGANDPQFPTQYHLPIVDGEFVAGTGGTSTEQKRKGVTRQVEKMFDGIVNPVYERIKTEVGNPPPKFRAVPEAMYNGQVQPFKKKMLDKVSEFTSVSGWEDKVSAGAKETWEKLTPWDTGGILPPGLNIVGNKTGTNEYILNPAQMKGLETFAAAFDPASGQKLSINMVAIGGEAITKGEWVGGGGGGSSMGVSAPSGSISPDASVSYTAPATSGANTPSMGPQTSREKTIAAVVAEGRRRGLSDEDIQSAVATVLVESDGKIYANESVPESMSLPHDAVGSDHDSVGPFQQRNSWGSAADRMDPTKSAALYYDSLAGVQGKDGMTIGQRAQAVQRSAFPEKYDQRAAEAAELMGSVSKTNPLPVEVMPTTADTAGRDVTEGSAYGQPLQGAAIDNATGEYLPENNTYSNTGTATTPTDSLAVHRENGLTVAKSFASTFGFDKQVATLEEKGAVIGELSTAVTEAIPAYAAAIAGNPTELMARSASNTAAWGAKTAADFATFGVENAGGMLESALSMFGAPLLAGGTVNIGANEQQVQSALEDQSNRRQRRFKEGRRRG